jgi:ABC-type glycerol-3-phosphate transport system substrate-binding protein
MSGTGEPISRRTVFGGAVRGAGLLAAGAAGAALAACAPVGQPAPDSATQAGELTWQIADFGGTAGQAWFEQTLIPGFIKERPKAQVNLIFVTWTEHGPKRDTLFAAGQGPDVLQSGAGQAHAFRKLVLPLDDRLRRWKEWGDYYPTTLATSTWKDKPYGIPARIDARAMVYRQDLFQKQGIKLPETWDEFRLAVTALTRREGGELVQLGYDPSDWDGANGSQRFTPRVWQNGGEIVSEDGRKPLFNSTEGVDALRFHTELFNTIAPLNATLPAPPTGASRLAGGSAAAMLAGQWIQSAAIQVVPDAVPNLVVRPPLKQRRQQINVFSNWFGLGAQSKYPDLAWDLMMHFNRADNLLEYLRLNVSTLPRKNLPDTPFTSDPRYQIKTWAEVLEKYTRPNPLIVNQTGTDPYAVLTAAMKAVREGQQSPKQALDEAARMWQESLDAGAREFGL